MSYLSVPILRESAAECLRGIINKGMDPIPKLELVEGLAKQLESAKILSTVSDEVPWKVLILQIDIVLGAWLMALVLWLPPEYYNYGKHYVYDAGVMPGATHCLASIPGVYEVVLGCVSH